MTEDSGSYAAAWASSIAPGPADESGTVTFATSGYDATLFSSVPAIATNGRLTFTPAANKFGSTSVTVTASDPGGATAVQTFSITITAVNDLPSFTKGANVTVFEDSATSTVTNWATAISPGPEEGTQTVTFTVTATTTSLFSVQPAVNAAGDLTFTPAPNANGSTSVSVTAVDSAGASSAAQTFTIAITAVNDAPSFTKGADVSVSEDSAAYSTAWATGISAGPSNESGQNVSFTVTSSNTALFKSNGQPAVSSVGVLSFTPEANAFGSATITVTLSDNGSGTAPDVNTSASQIFTITITDVNDAPSFTKGSNQVRNEDSGSHTVANWATNMSTGPSNESAQTISFLIANSNSSLFTASGEPAVSVSGDLTFTLAPDANGVATVTVTAMDSGSGIWPNENLSFSQTFTITVNAVNDAPLFTKGADIAVNEDSGAYSAAWATGISAGADNESSQILTFTVTAATTSLFSVQPAVSAAGVLSFTPALNATGSTSVTVHLADNGSNTSPNVNVSGTQTFTITLNPVNDAPVATAMTVSVNEDSLGSVITVEGTDVETASANLTDIVLSLPTNGILRDGATTITNELLPYTLPASGQITYVPTSNYAGSDSFTFKVRDRGQPDNCAALLIASTCTAALDSAAATVTISVTEVNDAPSLSLPTNVPIVVTRNVIVDGEISYDPITGLPLTYEETLGSGLWVTETSAATVVDVGALVTDDSTNFKGGSLTVSSGSHSVGGSILGDRLGIRNEGSGAGQIGISSRDVLYGGVVIGSFAGGGVQGGALQPLVITFNSRAADPSVSKAAVQALLRNITFWNDVATVKDPAETRVLSFLLNDGGLANDPTTDANARKLVYVEPVYNPPTVVLGSGPFTVLEQAAPFALAPSATLTDLDTTNFSGAVLTVDYTTAVSTLNSITIRDGAGSGGDPVNIEGGFLYYGNSKIGSWRNGDNGSALVVKFSARTVSLAQVQDVIRAIMFANTSDAPMAQRTVRFKLDDGSGAVTDPRPTVVVNITPVNDNPIFTLGRSSASYTEDAAPSVLSPKVTVTDPDGSSLSGPTLTVRFIANGRAEDELGILNEGLVANKIGVSGNQVYWSGSAIGTFSGGTAGTTLVVSLVGSVPVTVVEALAQNITYHNTSQAPVTTSRTVGLLLDDGSGGSAPEASLTLSVIAVNDAPINTVPTGVTVNEDFTVSGLVASIADIDAGSANLEVTLTAADGQVTFGGSTGASVTKTGTLSALNTLLNGFSFTPDANYFGDTTITMLTSDLGNTGTLGAQTDSDDIAITVYPINDAPVFVVGSNPSVLEDSGEQSIAVMSSVSAGPLEDGLGQVISFIVTDVTDSELFTDDGQPVMNSAGVVTFTPVADLVGTATVTVKATDDGSNTSPHVNTSGTQTFTITIGSVNDAPSFTVEALHVVDEDSGDQSVATWVDDISPGPENESSQTVWFTITNVSKPELFSAGPSIAADGTLTYSTAPNAFGTATITVIATDSGPGTDPNVNVSAPQTFDITLEPVNDGPTFVLGTDPEVLEDSGNFVLTDDDDNVVSWVAEISAGPGEDLLGQTIEFGILTNTNPDLFSVAPSIDPNGVLTFRPADNAFGVATLTVQANDSDLSTLPDIDLSTVETFTITVLPVNDPPFISVVEDSSSVQTAIQYSDAISPVTVTYGDIDSPVDVDNLWTTYVFTPADGSTMAAPVSGLPKGLELVSMSAPSPVSAEGQVQVAGRLMVASGTYTVTVGITDGDETYPGPGSDEEELVFVVDHEDADADFAGDVQVSTAGPSISTASVLLRAHL
ncbi:MAG: beta strand repeat-containing protein, partial [Actinomycetota bacterium]